MSVVPHCRHEAHALKKGATANPRRSILFIWIILAIIIEIIGANDSIWDHVQTVSKEQIGALITTLSAEKMERVRQALLFALGFDDIPY